MGIISTEDSKRAYSVARMVHASALTEANGIQILQEERGMNRASASDYIRNLRQMINGVPYHRTLNTFATNFYLQSILADFGVDAASNAIKSVRGHVIYYEGLGNGRLSAIARVCDEFVQTFRTSSAGNHQALEHDVEASRRLSPSDRAKASASYPVKPSSALVTSTVFKRNPHVVATVLERADGICERCGQPAPFKRTSNGQPYLEVHHIVQLANDGDDTVENAIAICPNCHREAHFG